MRSLKIITLIVFTIGSLNLSAQETVDEKTIEEQTKMATWNVNHAFKVYQTARNLNDIMGAKEALLDILVEVPQNDSIVFELGTMYFQLKMYQSAAICAMDVLTKNPDNIASIELAALSYENLGVEERALEQYEKLYLKTDDFNALYKTTLYQYNLSRFKEAEANIDILLTKKESDEMMIPLLTTENVQKDYPIKVVLYNIKGLIQKEQGNIDEARANFEKALELAPDFATAKEYLESLKN